MEFGSVTIATPYDVKKTDLKISDQHHGRIRAKRSRRDRKSRGRDTRRGLSYHSAL